MENLQGGIVSLQPILHCTTVQNKDIGQTWCWFVSLPLIPIIVFVSATPWWLPRILWQPARCVQTLGLCWSLGPDSWTRVWLHRMPWLWRCILLLPERFGRIPGPPETQRDRSFLYKLERLAGRWEYLYWFLMVVKNSNLDSLYGIPRGTTPESIPNTKNRLAESPIPESVGPQNTSPEPRDASDPLNHHWVRILLRRIPSIVEVLHRFGGVCLLPLGNACDRNPRPSHRDPTRRRKSRLRIQCRMPVWQLFETKRYPVAQLLCGRRELRDDVLVAYRWVEPYGHTMGCYPRRHRDRSIWKFPLLVLRSTNPILRWGIPRPWRSAIHLALGSERSPERAVSTVMVSWR